MSMSSINTAEPTVINTCTAHTQGDGRACVYYAEEEYYSQNTLDGNVSISNQ